MRSYGELFLSEYEHDWDHLISLIDRGEVPKLVYLYIHSQVVIREKILKYKCGGDKCRTDERFGSLVENYARVHACSIETSYAILSDISRKTSQEAALETLKVLQVEYGIKKPQLETILGFNPGGLTKILNGERPVYQEILMMLLMFLEYDLEECSTTLRNCGFVLCDCFPDYIYKQHIENRDFSICSYVNDVIETMRSFNMERAKNGRKQIKLHQYYRRDQVYPDVSASAFKVGDGYSFTKADLDIKLY